MWRELIITDVTRMAGQKVCIAGVDHKGNCIRPIPASPRYVREIDLYNDDNNLVIQPRAVVEMFIEPEPEIQPPHVEDHVWITPNETRYLRYADDTIWRLVLERTTSKSVEELFQAPLYNNKMIEPGKGTQSLGTIKPLSVDRFGFYKLKIWEKDKFDYRLSFTDDSGVSFVGLPVTDLSLRCYTQYLYVHGKMSTKKIRFMMAEKLNGAEIWLRLGLTRPFQKSDDASPMCYLQITGIYTFPDYLEGKCFADFAI